VWYKHTDERKLRPEHKMNMLLLPLVAIAICGYVAAIKLSDIAKDIRKVAEELRIIKSNLFFDLEKRYPELQDNPPEDANKG
jgi:hypothetical protein